MPTPTEDHKTTSHRDVYVRSHQSCHTLLVFSIFSAHLCAGFDMKTQRCGVTIKGNRGSSEKNTTDYDPLPVSVEEVENADCTDSYSNACL